MENCGLEQVKNRAEQDRICERGWLLMKWRKGGDRDRETEERKGV